MPRDAQTCVPLCDHVPRPTLVQRWRRGGVGRGRVAGSVANFAQGGMKGQVALVWVGLGSQGVELFGRSAALGSLLSHQLFFLDHVHEFNTS